MSRDAKVALVFAGSERVFRLGIGELAELEELRDRGPLALLRVILAGDWKTGDVREVIRLGLIGGGMTAKQAYVMTRQNVDDRPDWAANMAIAGHVLEAALFGPADDPVGKNWPATMTETTDSTSPASTETAP